MYDGYPGGQAAAAVQEAQYAYQIAQIASDAALKSLVYQTKQAYCTLLGDQNTVLVRQAIEKQAGKNLTQMQGFLTAQRATQLDLLQVQVALTQAQLDLRSAQNTLDTDRKELSLAVGWPINRQYAVADAGTPAVPSTDQATAEQTAFQNRAELKTMDVNLASANVEVALQKSQYAPSVSINGTVDLAQNWGSGTGSANFTAGLSISLPPIYDGTQIDSLVRQQTDRPSL